MWLKKLILPNIVLLAVKIIGRVASRIHWPFFKRASILQDSFTSRIPFRSGDFLISLSHGRSTQHTYAYISSRNVRHVYAYTYMYAYSVRNRSLCSSLQNIFLPRTSRELRNTHIFVCCSFLAAAFLSFFLSIFPVRSLLARFLHSSRLIPSFLLPFLSSRLSAMAFLPFLAALSSRKD